MTLDILIAKAIEGDLTAYERAMSLLKEPLFKFCYHLCGNRAQAEDLLQEAFFRGFKKLKTLQDPRAASGWFKIIAKNVYIKEWNKFEKRRGTQPEGQEEGAEDLAQSAELLAVRDALAKLGKDDRLILILIDIEENSYMEAAVIIGKSENAVRSQLHRARQRLKSILEAETKPPPFGSK